MISSLKYKFLFSVFLMSSFLKADLYDLYNVSFLRDLPSEIQCLIAKQFLQEQPFFLFNNSDAIFVKPCVESLSAATFSQTDKTILLCDFSQTKLYLLKKLKDHSMEEPKSEILRGSELQKYLKNKTLVAVKLARSDDHTTCERTYVSIDQKNYAFAKGTSLFSWNDSWYSILSRFNFEDDFDQPYALIKNSDLNQWNLSIGWNTVNHVEARCEQIPIDYRVTGLSSENTKCIHVWRHKGKNKWIKIAKLTHPAQVYSADCDETQDRIITASTDGIVRIWSYSPLQDLVPQKIITFVQLLFLRMINVIHNRGCEIKLEEIAQKLHGPLSLNLPEGLSVENYLFGILESFGDEVKQELSSRYTIILPS
jgi:WD40 repeat protein